MFSSLLSEFARRLERSGHITNFRARSSWRAWIFAAVALAAIVIAYVEKRPLQLVFRGNGRGAFAFVSTIVWRFFDGTWVALLAIALVAFGVAKKTARARETGITLGVAGVWCLLFTKLGQFVFAEARPNEGGAMHFFASGGHGVSGHASASTVLFFPLLDSVRGASPDVRVAIALALVAWALFVGATRVWLDQHFVWNVLAGYSVGAVAGWLACEAKP